MIETVDIWRRMWALEIVIVINCRIQQQNNLRPGQKDRNDNNSKVSSGDDFIYDRDINYLLVYNQCLLQECQECSLVNSVVYQKMVSIAGNIHCADIDDSLTDVFPGQQHDHHSSPAQCYIMCCCSSQSSGHSSSGAHARCAQETAVEQAVRTGGCDPEQSCAQCERDHVSGQTRAVTPAHSSSVVSGQCQGEQTPVTVSSTDEPMETSQTLWTGVSGVPGLGVSIPRSRPVASASLSEWDRHDHTRHKNSERQTSSRSGSVTSGGRAGPESIPRPVLSGRSSSCRSSGRSNRSSVSNGGISSGSSSSKYSNRSNSSNHNQNANKFLNIQDTIRSIM